MSTKVKNVSDEQDGVLDAIQNLQPDTNDVTETSPEPTEDPVEEPGESDDSDDSDDTPLTLSDQQDMVSEEDDVDQEADADADGEGEPDDAAAAGQDDPAPIDFKIKVRNQEIPIDDFFKLGNVKTDADKEKIKELYTKAYGLDVIKPKFEEVTNELNSLKEYYTPIVQEVVNVGRAAKEGDLEPMMKAFNIPFEKVLQYTASQLQYEKLPPEERARIDSQRQLQQEQSQREQALSLQQQQLLEQATRMREMELDMVLAKPEVSAVAAAFDQKFAGRTTFRDEVIKQGRLAYFQSNGAKDPSATEIVNELVQTYGWMAQPQNPAANGTGASQTKSRTQQRPKTLPNISGHSGSPARKVPGSLKELKQIAKEKLQQMDYQEQ